MKRTLLAAAFAALALPAAAQDAYVIGVTAAMTGPAAGTYAPTVEAMKAYLEHVNAKGGINGKQVRVIVADDGMPLMRQMHADLMRAAGVQRRFHQHAVLFAGNENHCRLDRRLVAVQVFDECANAALKLEDFLAPVTLVGELNANSWVEKRQFAQPFCQDVEVKLGVAEDFAARLEANDRAILFRGAGGAKRRLGVTQAVTLLIRHATAEDDEVQGFR